MQWVALLQLITLFGPKLGQVLPLLTQLGSLIKAHAPFEQILPVLLQILAVFVPTPTPPPTPPGPGPGPIVFATPKAGEEACVAAAVQAGVSQHDAEALVKAFK